MYGIFSSQIKIKKTTYNIGRVGKSYFQTLTQIWHLQNVMSCDRQNLIEETNKI